MKTFKEFFLEARTYTRTRSREEADRLRQSREDPSLYRLKNRQSSEMPLWGLESIEKREGQQQRRSERIASIDSDLDPKIKGRGEKKLTKIRERGKDPHHLTKIVDSAKEFAGLTPEERRVKREKDAKSGKFHGNDPRNIAQTDKSKEGTGILHRGESGYHSSQKAVGKGGSIQDFGSEKEILAVKLGIKRRGYSALRRFENELRSKKPKFKNSEERAREQRERMNAAADKRNLPD